MHTCLFVTALGFVLSSTDAEQKQIRETKIMKQVKNNLLFDMLFPTRGVPLYLPKRNSSNYLRCLAACGRELPDCSGIIVSKLQEQCCGFSTTTIRNGWDDLRHLKNQAEWALFYQGSENPGVIQSNNSCIHEEWLDDVMMIQRVFFSVNSFRFMAFGFQGNKQFWFGVWCLHGLASTHWSNTGAGFSANNLQRMLVQTPLGRELE